MRLIMPRKPDVTWWESKGNIYYIGGVFKDGSGSFKHLLAKSSDKPASPGGCVLMYNVGTLDLLEIMHYDSHPNFTITAFSQELYRVVDSGIEIITMEYTGSKGSDEQKRKRQYRSSAEVSRIIKNKEMYMVLKRTISVDEHGMRTSEDEEIPKDDQEIPPVLRPLPPDMSACLANFICGLKIEIEWLEKLINKYLLDVENKRKRLEVLLTIYNRTKPTI